MEFDLIFGCGINNFHQLKDGPSIICCPSLLTGQGKINDVQIIISKILWKRKKSIDESGVYVLTGYQDEQTKRLMDTLDSDSVVRLCEERFLHQSRFNTSLITRGITINFELPDSAGQHFSDCAVGGDFSYILSKDGKIFDPQNEISLPGIKFVQISCGKEHSLALSSDGEVYSWGSGMRGQLGNGLLATNERPEVVTALQGINIKSIITGGWHSVALSQTGDVYTWGWNDVGQLGFPSKSLRSDSVKWDPLAHSWTCQCGDTINERIKIVKDSTIQRTKTGEDTGISIKCDKNIDDADSTDRESRLLPICHCSRNYDSPCISKSILSEDRDKDLSNISSINSCSTSNSKCSVESCDISCSKKSCIKCLGCQESYNVCTEASSYGSTQSFTKSSDNTLHVQSIKRRCTEKSVERSILKIPADPQIEPKKANTETLVLGIDNAELDDDDDDFMQKLNPERCAELVNVQTTPKLLDYWKMDVLIKDVACGDRHTMFLMEDKSVWGVGWNKYGQLGIGSTESNDQPQPVKIQHPIEKVFCGGWSSVFIIAK